MRRSISIALLSFCLLWGCGPREVKKVERLETRLTHEAKKEHVGKGDALIEAKVESTARLPQGAVKLNYKIGERWFSFPMREGTEKGIYQAEIPHQKKGTVVSYFIEVTTVTGDKITLPERALEGDEKNYYHLVFKGRVPSALKGVHIGLMLGGLVLILISGGLAYRFIKRGGDITGCLYTAFTGAILLFLGGFPIGVINEKLTYGTFWEGWPLGRDVTDTKTEVLLLYWILALLPMKNTIFKKIGARNWISDKTFAYLVIIGAILTIMFYLIPHKNIKF